MEPPALPLYLSPMDILKGCLEVSLGGCNLPNLWSFVNEQKQKLFDSSVLTKQVNTNFSYQLNLSLVSTFELNEEIQNCFKKLFESHSELKRIETGCSLSDYHELESDHLIDKAVTDINSQIKEAQKKGSKLSETLLTEVLKLDRIVRNFWLPAENTPRFNLFQARQQFLNSIEAGLLCLKNKGVYAVWEVDCSQMVLLLEKSRDILKQQPSYMQLPQTQSDLKAKKAEDYKKQFSHVFLQEGMAYTYNLMQKYFMQQVDPRLKLIIERTHFCAIQSLGYLMDLREALDKTDFTTSTNIKPASILTPLVQFAFHFGKLKEISMQMQRRQL